MKKLLFIVFITFTTIVFSQQKIQIIDIQTKEPIGFATIVIGEGVGGYTDEDGYFYFDKKQNFSINMLGYKTLFVAESDFRDTIELEVEPVLIDEIVVSNKKRKQKISEQKPYWKNSTWLDSYTPQIGNEIAVLIPNDEKQQMILSKITIPVATNPYRVFDKKSKELFKRFEELPHTTIRIRFYSNENNKPKEILYSDDIVVNIHNYKEKYPRINLEEYQIKVPEDGLFIGIEFIGFADQNQKYFYVPNFRIVKRNGIKVKSSNSLDLCIPIDQKNKKEYSYIRYSDWEKNGEKLAWKIFAEEAFLKLNQDQEKFNGTANIGLGYELKIYE